MAKYTITLEVDSGQLFDTLHQLQQEGVAEWAGPFGDRMASLLMTPRAVGMIAQVGLGLYGITIKQVDLKAE